MAPRDRAFPSQCVHVLLVLFFCLLWPTGHAETLSHSRLLREQEPLPTATTGLASQEPLMRVQEFGLRFVERRAEARDGDELSLISTHKHTLWYSEDGLRRKRFKSRGHDALGHAVINEIPLRLGDEWHLVFRHVRAQRGSPLAEEEEEEEEDGTPQQQQQRHYVTVFEHVQDHALSVTHHTWSASAPSGGPPPHEEEEEEEQQQQQGDEQERVDQAFHAFTALGAHLRSLFLSSADPSPSSSTSSSSSSSSGSHSDAPEPEKGGRGRGREGSCRPVKMATFNIWNFNAPWEDRLQMINEHMTLVRPDVVGWQEVRYDLSQPRRSQVEQLLELPAFRGYQFVWARGMTYLNFNSRKAWHVDEGVAVFSRFPITQADHRVLSRNLADGEDREHQRVCLRARVQPPGGCRPLDFFVTHLTLSDPARDRTVLEIAGWVASLGAEAHLNQPMPFVMASHSHLASDAPTHVPGERAAAVLVGDLNTEPGSRALELLLTLSTDRVSFIDTWLTLHPDANAPHAAPSERGLSFPTWKPQKRIDFILAKREECPLHVQVLDVQLFGNTSLAPEKRDLHREVSSDHLGLWALIDLGELLSPKCPSPTKDEL